jgi:uncharacterized protein YjbI with pentapeptide repeats
MANQNHMDIIKRGVDYWNTWRFNNSHISPSLSEAGLHMAYLSKANLSKADLSDSVLRLADLNEANLKGADLYWANASEANLRCADLRDANLNGANMTGSNLRGTRLNSVNMSQANMSRAYISSSRLNNANLYGADLRGADLSNSILKGANLVGANLTGANLEGADLTNAIVGATSFGNVDLSNVKGLESLMHIGSSTVGIDTVYMSKGKIPVLFLRNAGVPRHLIDYVEQFADQDKKYSSCLISYSQENEEFALKMYEDLQDHGIRCWVVNEKFKKRDRNQDVMKGAVNLHDKLVLVLSEDSITKEWAENEYNHAIEKEMTCEKTTLVPVSLDDAVQYAWQPWAIKMRRSRFIADFSEWQDIDSYQKILRYLLDELSIEGKSSDCGDESQQEISDADNDFSEVTRVGNVRDLPHAYRPEYQQFC